MAGTTNSEGMTTALNSIAMGYIAEALGLNPNEVISLGLEFNVNDVSPILTAKFIVSDESIHSLLEVLQHYKVNLIPLDHNDDPIQRSG